MRAPIAVGFRKSNGVPATEGSSPVELRFASLEAAANLRPSLQITYVPRNAPGIP